MAIADFKRITIMVMKRDREELLHFLQHTGCVEITPLEFPQENELSAFSVSEQRNEETLSRLKWAINRLSRLDTKKQSMFAPLPEAGREELISEDFSEAIKAIDEAELLERQSGEIRGHLTRVNQTEEQLKPWLGLDIPSHLLKDTRTSMVFTGHASTQGLVALKENWQGRPAFIQAFGADRDSTYFYALVHRNEAQAFQEELKAIDYQYAAPFSGASGTPGEQLQKAQAEAQKLLDEQKRINEELAGLTSKLPALRVAYDNISARKERLEALNRMANTQTVSMLAGWVPESVAKAVEEGITRKFPEAQVIIASPADGEEPPVLLENHPVTRPYEAVVSGFALPAPGSVDPTSLMMPFFACFFGMMVSDAGYGIMMAILIPIMIKVMKPSQGARKLFWILFGGGIATIFWGALYNTWFGFAPWPSVFDPVNNSLPVMAACVGIGALHLFAGMGLGIYKNIKNGSVLDAIYDQVSWLMLVIGAGLLFLSATAEIGKWMAIAGAGIVLLTAGRNKSKNPVKRLLSGLGALYGVSSWISDLLSYMRLFGMGLATGVIGMVINQLVGMIMGGGIIGMVLGAVIFVGAHLFNAAINILGAYVHACRLQYIEFFGKFFEEGGRPFKPLRFAPRYVRIRDS